jgi:Domain of unknown function (DUF5801)
MALDIVAQDIIIDETTGLQDDDVDSSVSPHNNATVQYLLSLDSAGGLASPEVAFQADFVEVTAGAGETVTSIILAQDSTGTPFSITDGVNSGIRTVDGNYVWLFRDPNFANVVIGVIGTSDQTAEPDEGGALAFSFALISTSNTSADLYTVQYVPLLHPIETNPDDRIDLTDVVFAAAAGTTTTTVNFSGQNAAPSIHEFYLINSPDDASKQLLVTGFVGAANADANVSTQGFGVKNQSINPTETLQVDFVTGGDLNAGTGSQIQYDSHLDDITQAGFTINQITPSNPNLRVDIRISAFDVQGNEQGSDFFNGSPTNPADITSITLTGASGFASTIIADGTYATASGNVTVTGIDGTGNSVTIEGLDNITTVNVTTSSQMDRLTVTGVDSNEGLDITEFHFTQQITSPNAINEEVGSFINFDDDGPSIDPSAAVVPPLTVDETDFATDASASFAGLFTSAFGNDGFKDADNNDVEDADAISYKLDVSAPNVASGLVDTLTNEAVTLSVNADGTVVTGSSATGGTVFTITLDADTGDVTLDQVRAVVHDDPLDPDESSSPAQLSAANLVTLTATITDGDLDTDTATRDIGDAFKFEDDGPTISPAIADGQVAFTAGASDGDTGFLAYGADGPASVSPFKITAFEAMPDDTPLGTITETLSSDGTELTYSSVLFGDLFQLTLDATAPGGYTFTVLQEAPTILNVLDFGSVSPGGPVEEIPITAPGGTIVTFDGFLASDSDGDPTSLRDQFGTGDLNADPIEDVNVSQQGIGLKDNQMDPNVNAAGQDEALKMSFSQDVDGVQVVFDGATGGGKTFDATFEAYDGGVLVGTFTFDDLAAPKGNATTTVTFTPDAQFDELFIGLNVEDKSGVRIHQVALIEQVDIPDFALDYTVQATDGDADTISDMFTVQIDSTPLI